MTTVLIRRLFLMFYRLLQSVLSGGLRSACVGSRAAVAFISALGLLTLAGVARAQIPLTPEQAVELVQAQAVAGEQTDTGELEAAATSVIEFDPLSPQVYGPGTIEQIVVRGNQRLSSATILSILPVRVGQDFQPIRLDNALKALYATGQFADVRIDRSGNVLIIQVRENVLINQINFEGNGAINDEELFQLIDTTSRSVLSRTQVAEDIRKIKQRYEILGRLLVVIEPKIIPLTENRANLVFEINEGARTRIDAINFVGNQAYTDRRLRSIILSKQSNIVRNLLQADSYSPGRVTVDRNFLTEYYQSRGFADFEVVSAIAEQTPEKRGFILTFTVKEGIRYRVGQIRIANNLPGVDTSRLVNRLKVRTGQTFDITEVEATQEDLTERVSAQGFPFVEVDIEQNLDPTRGIVDLTYTIEEGDRLFVERIVIEGNERTADDVIRREFRLSEGDAFSVSKLQRSQARLLSLGYFASVEFEPEAGSSPDQVVVVTQVEEQRTGELMLGGTYSNTAGILGNFKIADRNFRGRGQKYDLDINAGIRNRDASFSVTEPYFLGREISAGVELFYNDRNVSNIYDRREIGADVTLGYKLSERLSQSWTYGLTQTEVSNVAENASLLITQQEGRSIRSEARHFLRYDRRDVAFNPTEGYLLSMRNSVAGLGGSVRYLKTTAEATHYLPLGETFTFATRAEGGFIEGLGQDTLLADRFIIGGDLIRGFTPAGLGPREQNSGNLGAARYWRTSAELRFPLPGLGEQGVKGRLFADAGAAWHVGQETGDTVVQDSADPRASVGIGATWDSPLGPLSIDYGIPLAKKSFDVEQRFRFSISTSF